MSWWLRTIERPTTLVLVILLAHFVAKRPELLGVKSDWSTAQEPLPLLFQLLSKQPRLPRSSAYDSLYNGLAARKQRQCILPGDSHALHDLFGRQQLLGSCEAEDEYFGLWHRLVSSVQQAWFQLSQCWRPWLTEEIVVEVLNQQRNFANLGLAALELQPAARADPLAKAVRSIHNHSRPEAQVAKELQISVEALSWLQTHSSELAEAVDDIFTAQVLGLQQSKWLRSHKDKWNDVLGEVGAFLFSRFRGRPHPVLLHQSAEAITALMQSIWIDEKNMAEQSAELEEQVERASDSGSLPDLLMKTAVDESWVLQLQSLALGLPWLPDLPAYSGVDVASTTHEELSRILSGKGSLSAKLLSPLHILQRNDSEASGWTSVPLSEWYPSPVEKLHKILAEGHMVNPRLAEVAQAIYQGDVAPLCQAVSDALFDQNTTSQVFLSLCPTATEARDLWKEPLALVLGVAQRLPQHLFFGLGDLQTVLRSLWETAGKRLSVPLTPENLAETGCSSSVISVWPLHLAGAARMTQDPHILQYSTGSAALVMDTISLKCKGKWSNASMTLGGPQVLSDEACVRSILAAHVAWREGPQRLSMVGRVQPIVGATNEELWDALSPYWRQLALQPVASAQPAIAAFGAWWPVLRLLWADAGAVLGCGRSNVGKKKAGETELCLWAILGRLADELRPWEDFVGSDSPVLLSATFLLGWFATKQVIYCSDWEDENTGEIHCDCGLPIGSAGESNGANKPLLKPSALPAAESLLELLSEIIIAGEAANVQKLYTSTMSNEDWRVLFSCVVQTSHPRRYLLLDRLDLNLPNRARNRLVNANSAQTLEELLQPGSDTDGK